MASKTRQLRHDRLYVLNGLPGLSITANGASGSRYGDYPKCDHCGKAIDTRDWLPPYRAELSIRDSEFPDLAKLPSNRLLVSERFCDLLHDSKLVGLSGFEPVRVMRGTRRTRSLDLVPGYLKADVTRSEAAIDYELSGFGWSPPSPVFCRVCRSPLEGETVKRWARLVLEPNTWAGEDVFVPKGVSQILVTRRFKELCDSNDLKNALFTPADGYAYDFYPWERDDWEAQLFDETLAVLRERNWGGRFDKVLEQQFPATRKTA